MRPHFRTKKASVSSIRPHDGGSTTSLGCSALHPGTRAHDSSSDRRAPAPTPTPGKAVCLVLSIKMHPNQALCAECGYTATKCQETRYKNHRKLTMTWEVFGRTEHEGSRVLQMVTPGPSVVTPTVQYRLCCLLGKCPPRCIPRADSWRGGHRMATPLLGAGGRRR